MKRNRTLLGILSIIIGLAVCFGLLPVFNKMLSGKAEIIRAREVIPEGIQITPDMIENVTVGSYGLPDDVIKADQRDTIIGKYSTVEICKNDYILPTKVQDELLDAEHIISSLNGSKWAISIEVTSLADSVSAKIQSGDVVSVIAIEGEKKTGVIYPELQYIEVIATTNTDTVDVSQVDKKEENNTPKTITFLANKVQSEILARLSSEKNAHVAIVCRKDNVELKEQLLNFQDELTQNNSQPSPEASEPSEPVETGENNQGEDLYE